MYFSTIIVTLALSFAAVSDAVSINDIPGFENFKGCHTKLCWDEIKEPIRQTMRTGYEPLGFPKIEPQTVEDNTVKYDDVTYTIKNFLFRGFDTVDLADFNVDLAKKEIREGLTFDITMRARTIEEYHLEKEYIYDSYFEIIYRGVKIFLTRRVDFNQADFDGKAETFLVNKGYDVKYEFQGVPEIVLDDHFDEKFNENPALKEWYYGKGGKEQVDKAKMAFVDYYIEKFADAYMSLVAKFDETFPISTFQPPKKQEL